jgi:hypothetical protein
MSKFSVTDKVGTTRLFPQVESLLDSLEAGVLGADDIVFDAGRKEWVSIKDHPEVQAAWEERQRYRPLDDRRSLGSVAADPLGFPRLGEDGITPQHGIPQGDDFEIRRAAWRAIRDNEAPAHADVYQSGETLLKRGAFLGAVVLVAMICAALVLIATGIARLTAR